METGRADNPGAEVPETLAALAALARFREALETYMATQLYAQYAGTGMLEDGADLLNLTESLETAIRAGDRTLANRAAAGIRVELAALQHLDSQVAGQAFARLFYLFVFFMLIISGLSLLLWRLRRALRQSRTQERDSANFSRMIMLAQETERSRIAAELHDTALQDLGRLLRISEKAGNDFPELVRHIMTGTRAVCMTLMPPDFSRLALADSLRQLCMDFEQRSSVECRTAIAEDFSAQGFSPETQLQIYRIVQEGLTNIEKHAHAAEAALTARNENSSQGQTLLICISDDGNGLPAQTEHRGLGIRGMYERAAMIGADLSFISEPGQGLTVRLKVKQTEAHP